MMERVALSAGRCGSECVEYSVWTNIWIINRRHIFFELTEEGIFIRCQRCFYQTDSVLCISLSIEEVFVLETIEILFLEY